MYIEVVPEQTSGADGILKFERLEKFVPDCEYYLVETWAPEGYLRAAPIQLNLSFEDDVFTTVPDDEQTDARPGDSAYDWTQRASLTLAEAANLKRINAQGDVLTPDDLAALIPDSETGLSYYKLRDNTGASLPATGGPGTTLYTATGLALIALALAMLLRRREI